MGKPGGHSTATVYRADDNCNYHVQGHIDIALEIKFGTGSMWFTAEGEQSPQWPISQLGAIFGPGSTIEFFKDWVAHVSSDGLKVTVNNGSEIVAVSESDGKYTATTISFFTGGSVSFQYQQQWYGQWGYHVDLSDTCIADLLIFFGSAVATAVALIVATVPTAGFGDVIILAGVTAGMLGQRIFVQKACGF
jgi:hypothetical protein